MQISEGLLQNISTLILPEGTWGKSGDQILHFENVNKTFFTSYEYFEFAVRTKTSKNLTCSWDISMLWKLYF